MNVDAYVKNISIVKFSDLQCRYCGSEVLASSSSESICHFCESYVNTVAGSISKDSSEGKLIPMLQNFLDKGMWGEASKALDAWSKDSSDPWRAFSIANFYKNYSDIVYDDVNYNLPGFMEKNSDNRYQSQDLIAKSKLLFFMAIRLADDQLKKSQQQDLLYVKLMSNAKLGRLVQAAAVLDELNAIDKKNLIAQYADMVVKVESNVKGSEVLVGYLIDKKIFNAYFYLARYLIKNGKLEDSWKVLTALTSKTRMPMAVHMLKRVNEVLEETKV